MFRTLQCIQKGRVHMPSGCAAMSVHADDYGGAWVVSADAQDVSYYTPHNLAAAMEQRPPRALPLSYASAAGSSSSPHLVDSAPVSTLGFRCMGDGDHVHTVLFLNTDSNATPAASRRDVCVVTAGGVIALLRVPTAREEPPTLLQPYQEVHLDLSVSAAAAMPGAVVMCCFDGEFTEVVRAVVVSEAAPATCSSLASSPLSTPAEARCPHLCDVSVNDGLCTCAVEATGLFRVQGRITCVAHDSTQDFLVAVSDLGNVDVWDVALGRDATAQCGSPSWDTTRYGTATCAVVCRDRLWIGLTSGQLIVFSLAAARVQDTPSSDAAAAATGVVLRSHGSAVTDVVTMSMQSSIWSCAADSGKVNVWDAADTSFRGSFVFPEAGMQSLCVGAAQLRTALWGVDGASREPCLLHMTESLSRRDAVVCSRDDVRSQQACVALVASYRVCWEALLRHFGAVTQTEAAAAVEVWRSEAVVSALQSLASEAQGSADSHGAVQDLVAAMGALQRLAAMDRRVRGGGGRTVAAVVEGVMEEWRCHQKEREEVDTFLCGLRNSVCGDAGAASSVESLEEAAAAFTLLQSQVAELTTALASAADTQAHIDAIESAVSEATVRLQREVAALQETLHDAEACNDNLRAQLKETEVEREEAQARQHEVERLLEASETQLGDVKKSLLATKRAAEVKASEVSSLFDMESQLQTSQQVIAELSAKVEALLQDVEVKEEELAAYGRRQAAAKKVLQRVLHTQNTLADEVSAFADSVDALVADAQADPQVKVSKSVGPLLHSIQERASTLESSMESRLRDQLAWFHTLSHELRADLT